jgi:hypothetical protein
MKVVSDEQGAQVRGAGIAAVGGHFFVSSGGWGFPFGVGLGLGFGGGSTIHQHAAAVSGEAPGFASPAVASITTINPNTRLRGAIIVENAIVGNGFEFVSRGYASGGVHAFAR